MPRTTLLAKLAFLVLLALSCYAHGADITVSPNGSGNRSGSDWANTASWENLSFVRGNRYYLSDGIYSGKIFSTPNAGSSSIHILKATNSAHGPTSGWQSSFGDGEALFEDASLVFQSDFWVFDGVVGRSRGGNEQYGFRMFSDRAPDSSIQFIRLGSGADNITVAHVEIHRPSKDYRARVVDATDGGGSGMNSNIRIENCYFHDVFGVFYYFIGDNRVTIHNCIHARNKSTAAIHSEAIQARKVDHFTLSNNVWEDIQGTYGIGCANLTKGVNAASLHWRIFGNVFHVTNSSSGGGIHGHADIGTNFCDTGDWLIYNNTFTENDFRSSGYGGIKLDNVAPGFGGTNKAYNNLFYNERYIFMKNVEQANNTYANSSMNSSVVTSGNGNEDLGDTSSPFVSTAVGGADFRLLRPTSSGAPLTAPFDIDPHGVTRGADGVVDRGAFEYISELQPELLPAPTGLKVVQ